MKLVLQQYGQAMTEFNIAAAFVLVPVFILIPLMGKYIDIKHASVQSSRYMAWERTVWFERGNTPRDANPAVKSDLALVNETQNRFFTHANRKIDSRLDRSGLKDTDLNLLWTDNAGNQLVDTGSLATDFAKADATVPSSAYSGFKTVTTSIDTIPNKLASYLPFRVPRSDITTKFNYDGLYETDVQVAINNITGLEVFNDLNLIMANNNAAILTNTWNAQDKDQFREWTEDFVAANVLGIPRVMSPIQTIFGRRFVAPELSKDRLKIGLMNTDPVADSSQKPACPNGICRY